MAGFRYINAAVRETPEDFYAALNDPEFAAMRDATPSPPVYTVFGQ